MLEMHHTENDEMLGECRTAGENARKELYRQGLGSNEKITIEMN